MSGLFITLEGVEGCGKSTQLGLLTDYLEGQGHAVEVTREPGGTPVAEAVRGILLDPDHLEMTPITELLLYEAARAQHVSQRIQPALAAGKVVVCDRFADSTTAYQGGGRELNWGMIQELHRIATSGVWPALTLIIDLDPKEGLRRAVGAGKGDRIEQASLAFHERVRAAFLKLAAEEPERVKVVDGSESIDDVAATIRSHVDEALAAR
jgi:dTMP kinase